MDPDSKLKLISQLGLVDCCLDACCPNHATFAPLPSIWTTLKQQQPPGMVTTVLNESSDEFELESAKFCACLDKYDIQQEVLEFANKIIISNQPSGGGGGTMEIDFFAPNVVQSMFLAVLSCIRLPKDHNMSELLNGGGGNGVVEEDLEEEDFREHRSSVKRLFLNLVRCAGAGQILPMLQHLVHTCFDTQHNIESILYLVYAFGEAAPEISSMLKKNAQPNPDPLVQQLLINFDLLLVSIFQSPAFQNHVSAVVAIMYNELAARYTFNLRMHTCLPGIIQHICGLGGVHHSHCIVRSKAASLLLRMIRQLDLLCAPLCVPVLTSLQDVITNGLSFDVCLREPRRNRLASPAGGLSPVRSNQDSYYGSGGGVILAVPDALLIYEVVGFMLGNPALWSEEHIRRAYLTHVIQGTLEHSLQLACNSLHKTSHNNGAGHRYARANEDVTYWGACQLEALASVCKGFALQSNETIIALWRNVLRTGLIATVTFLKTGSADEDVLLNGLRRLCHALIRTLGVEILVFFPDICQCLLQETPNADICRALPLLNQMMSAFRGRMHDALAQSLLPILRATNSRIAPIANLSQHTTHDMVELFAMEKELFTFCLQLHPMN
ncbi:hypothetical protein BASA81_002534 [Batrachochytrium salamandrivorans]|nr:hypothetical protein BASA81_002534 [Batrachochytrium salamandrivorans]